MDYFDQLDVKSNVTKYLLPEHVRPCANPSTGHHNSNYTNKGFSESPAGADDFLYNETVMRGAFAQFLRRLADQVENGLISLFDAISQSPCHTSMPMTGQQNLNINTTFTNEATASSSSHNNNNNSINLTQIDSSPSPSPSPLHVNPSKQSPPTPQSARHHVLREESLLEVDSQSLDPYPGSSFGSISGDTNELRQIQQIEPDESKPQVFTTEESQDQSCHTKTVSLLSGELNPSQDPYPDVLVDSIRLESLSQRIEALSDPTTPEDMHRLSLSILREAINMTFTKIELANASGLGLRRTRTDSGYPLDRRKIEAIKLFYTSLCVRRQWPKVSKSTFHKAFTIKISNAKRDLRRL